MISDADTFWRQILARVRPGRVSDSVSLAEAEHRMAAAGEDEIAPERIARIARDVTGAAPAAARPQVVQGRVHRFPMARPALRWAVAATVALAPLAAVAFYKMYDEAPTQKDRPSASWDYPVAVRILCDESRAEKERRSAQVMVAAFIRNLGVRTVRAIRAEGGAVGAEADRLLSYWRGELEKEPSGVVTPVTDIEDIVLQVGDRQTPTDQRLRLLRQLSADIASGIAALRAPIPESEALTRYQMQALMNLADLLAE
jgi:hypothetical protein